MNSNEGDRNPDSQVAAHEGSPARGDITVAGTLTCTKCG
jgi:hypothetical protein